VGCLQRVASLRSLAVGGHVLEIKHAKPFLDALRLLTQLHTLTLPFIPAQCVEYLLCPPHQLELQELSGLSGLDDTAAAALLKLPSLQRLTAFRVDCTSFAVVKQLREVRFGLSNLEPATHAALLASAAAGHFAQIIKLELQRGNMQSDELSALLAGMPHLASLTLNEWRQLPTLHFLLTPPLQASLTELGLTSCPALPPAELEHVFGLKQLRGLALVNSFNAPLPADVVLQLESRRCLQLPLLKRFKYCAPTAPRYVVRLS